MIGVIGTGSFGTSLAKVLADNASADILLWGRNKEQLKEIEETRINSKYLPGVKLPVNLKVEYDLSSLLYHAKDLLIVVPSKSFREIILQIAPYITEKHRIVWATKGLDISSGKFLHEVIEEVFGKNIKYGVLSGPSFAIEIANNMPTAVSLAVNDIQFGDDLVEYFHSKTFRVYKNQDIIGVELGGAVKNIFAVACGISDGLNLGANARAALITRGLAEMFRLGKAIGALDATLMGLSGCGDIILSCTDDKSRNRRLGLALGYGKNIIEAQKEIGQSIEALDNCTVVYNLGKKYSIDLPIISQVKNILTDKITPKEALENLISRKPKSELL